MSKIRRASSPPPVPLSALPPLPETTLRDISLQGYLMKSLQDAMKAGGYTLKQRSIWIEEALAGLLVHDPAIYESATGERSAENYGGQVDARLKRTKLLLGSTLDHKVQELVRELQHQNPEVLGPYSYIVRCAVRHRLRNPKLYPRTGDVERQALIRSALAVNLEAPF